jgi:hypothetical protein
MSTPVPELVPASIAQPLTQNHDATVPLPGTSRLMRGVSCTVKLRGLTVRSEVEKNFVLLGERMHQGQKSEDERAQSPAAAHSSRYPLPASSSRTKERRFEIQPLIGTYPLAGTNTINSLPKSQNLFLCLR